MRSLLEYCHCFTIIAGNSVKSPQKTCVSQCHDTLKKILCSLTHCYSPVNETLLLGFSDLGSFQTVGWRSVPKSKRKTSCGLVMVMVILNSVTHELSLCWSWVSLSRLSMGVFLSLKFAIPSVDFTSSG